MGEKTGMQGKKKAKLKGFLQANDSVVIFARISRIALYVEALRSRQLAYCSSSR